MDTDRDRAERWCKMANERTGMIQTLNKRVDKVDTLLATALEDIRTLKRQRDGLLALIALAMHVNRDVGANREMIVDTAPLPNGIDIGGSAVALDCTES